MTRARKLAEEIVGVLKFNPDLKDEEKILAVEIKLNSLVSKTEEACAEAYTATMVEHSALSDVMLQRQQHSNEPLN